MSTGARANRPLSGHRRRAPLVRRDARAHAFLAALRLREAWQEAGQLAAQLQRRLRRSC